MIVKDLNESRFGQPFKKLIQCKCGSREWDEAGMDVRFYLVKVEAYRIGNSEPAAKFTVISGPSERAEIVGGEKKELMERHRKRLEFWKGLLEKSKQKTSLHSNISPTIYSWIGTGSGKSGLGYNYVIKQKYGQVELYIDRGKECDEENKEIFDELFSKKEQIEQAFGEPLEWERLDDRRASRIKRVCSSGGLNDKDSWGDLQDEMLEVMIRFEKALKGHIKALKI